MKSKRSGYYEVHFLDFTVWAKIVCEFECLCTILCDQSNYPRYLVHRLNYSHKLVHNIKFGHSMKRPQRMETIFDAALLISKKWKIFSHCSGILRISELYDCHI